MEINERINALYIRRDPTVAALASTRSVANGLRYPLEDRESLYHEVSRHASMDGPAPGVRKSLERLLPDDIFPLISTADAEEKLSATFIDNLDDIRSSIQQGRGREATQPLHEAGQEARSITTTSADDTSVDVTLMTHENRFLFWVLGARSYKVQMAADNASLAHLRLYSSTWGSAPALGYFTLYYDGSDGLYPGNVATYWRIESPRLVHPGQLAIYRAHVVTGLPPDSPSNINIPVPERTSDTDNFEFPSSTDTRTLSLQYAYYFQVNPVDPRQGISTNWGGPVQVTIPRRTSGGGPPVVIQER